MRPALGAEADNGAGFVEERPKIDFFVGENFRGHLSGQTAADF